MRHVLFLSFVLSIALGAVSLGAEEAADPAAAAAPQTTTDQPAAAVGQTGDPPPTGTGAQTPDGAQTPSSAQKAPATSAQAAPDALPPIGVPLQGTLPLSLQAAITLGIGNNTEVEIIRHDPEIAEQDYRAAWGVHDPTLYGNFDYRSWSTPVASSLQTTNSTLERETTGATGLRGLIPKLGWQYDVNFSGRRLTTNSAIADLSPEYRSNISASLTAPLLRGAWWGEAWTQVKVSGIQSEVALQQFRTSLMDIVQAIENGYWNLAANKENLAVANKSLETSRALFDQTEAQYEVGVVSKVEVTEATAGVADREFRQIGALNAYRDSQDDLIDLVMGPRLTPTSSLEVIPSDSPEDYVPFNLDVEESTRKALQKRPELTIAKMQVDQQRVRLKFAKNQRLPQLDAVAGYGYAGLGGDTNSTPPLFGGVPDENGNLVRAPVTSVGRTFWSTDDDFFSSDGSKQWSAGAILSIPIPNTTARANQRASELELRKAGTSVVRQEQDIVKGVRRAVRNLESALEGIEAAERRTEAATEQERAEQIRLEHGESTPFDVLQREEDLVEAERQKILALQIYHSSVAELDREQGTILEDRNIIVEDALVR
jgi:outer membrane protein TolC